MDQGERQFPWRAKLTGAILRMRAGHCVNVQSRREAMNFYKMMWKYEMRPLIRKTVDREDYWIWAARRARPRKVASDYRCYHKIFEGIPIPPAGLKSGRWANLVRGKLKGSVFFVKSRAEVAGVRMAARRNGRHFTQKTLAKGMIMMKRVA